MSLARPEPPAAFDAVHRFTIEDYHRLADVGLLDGSERVELLDGQVIPMRPVGPEHHWLLRELAKAFLQQEHDRYETGPVRSLPLRLPRHDEPEPDLMLYRPGAAGRRRHVQAADVLLVLEISDFTLRRDLGFKAGLYERALIPEYWVVDVRNACVHVFTLTGGVCQTTEARAGRLSPRALPGIEIDVTRLFGAGD